MGSDIATKIIAAIAATLVAELTDKALDWAGIPEEDTKLPRAVIKAVAAAAAAFLTEDILSSSDTAVMGMPLDGEAA
jgi:hypothetical protein